jgi:hypothetical protein
VKHRYLSWRWSKQILEEVFHARPSDAEDMIHRSLEEESWNRLIADICGGLAEYLDVYPIFIRQVF